VWHERANEKQGPTTSKCQLSLVTSTDQSVGAAPFFNSRPPSSSKRT
jgi:hypothetical protein